VIANTIITMVGAQETTTNLIGNGLVTLLRHPPALNQLRDDPAILPTAVEELLRYESPSQQTTRIAPEDVVLGGQPIEQGQSVIAVMGAANRDPERFADPNRVDLTRQDNRHLAFGWGPHFCFGAPLARIESQIAFETLLTRLPELELVGGPLQWRANLKLRGLATLPIRWRI
jgi:cytochrome P450